MFIVWVIIYLIACLVIGAPVGRVLAWLFDTRRPTFNWRLLLSEHAYFEWVKMDQQKNWPDRVR